MSAKKFLVFVSLLMSFNLMSGQEYMTRRVDVISLGFGGGIDYGGLGLNLTGYVNNSVGFFAGAGYAIAGLGYNVGAKFRYVPQGASGFTPYVVAMYGYNAAVAVTNASNYNKLFYGPSVGIGFEFLRSPQKIGYWSFSLLVPIRSSEVHDYMDYLEDNLGVDFKNGLLPIAFSIGYRRILK